MQDLIQTITEEVSVKDHTFCLSVLRFNGVDETMDDVAGQQMIGTAYMQLVQELNENPNAQAQMSACLITDMSPIGDFLTKEALDEWYDNATADSVQTQRALYETFQRPVFTIAVLPGIDEAYIMKRTRMLNPSANTTRVVNNYGEAIELAQKMMGASHRI